MRSTWISKKRRQPFNQTVNYNQRQASLVFSIFTITGVDMVKQENDRLHEVVSKARRAREDREQGYREKALKMYPHVCGRCAREFGRGNLHELTVHHRDHNHDNNPADGSNWELLCLYCHDNEHQRQLEAQQGYTSSGTSKDQVTTSNPFADLKAMLEKQEDK